MIQAELPNGTVLTLDFLEGVTLAQITGMEWLPVKDGRGWLLNRAQLLGMRHITEEDFQAEIAAALQAQEEEN